MGIVNSMTWVAQNLLRKLRLSTDSAIGQALLAGVIMVIVGAIMLVVGFLLVGYFNTGMLPGGGLICNNGSSSLAVCGADPNNISRTLANSTMGTALGNVYLAMSILGLALVIAGFIVILYELLPLAVMFSGEPGRRM